MAISEFRITTDLHRRARTYLVHKIKSSAGPTPRKYNHSRGVRLIEMADIHPAKRAFDLYIASGGPQGEIVDGVLIPSGGRKDLRDLQSRFALRPSDVFLTSYPKTGSTWLLQTVKLIRNKGVEDGRDVDQAIPLLEYLTPEETEVFK